MIPKIKIHSVYLNDVTAARETLRHVSDDVFDAVQGDPDNCHLRVALNNLLNAQVTLDKLLSTADFS